MSSRAQMLEIEQYILLRFVSHYLIEKNPNQSISKTDRSAIKVIAAKYKEQLIEAKNYVGDLVSRMSVKDQREYIYRLMAGKLIENGDHDGFEVNCERYQIIKFLRENENISTEQFDNIRRECDLGLPEFDENENLQNDDYPYTRLGDEMEIPVSSELRVDNSAALEIYNQENDRPNFPESPIEINLSSIREPLLQRENNIPEITNNIQGMQQEVSSLVFERVQDFLNDIEVRYPQENIRRVRVSQVTPPTYVQKRSQPRERSRDVTQERRQGHMNNILPVQRRISDYGMLTRTRLNFDNVVDTQKQIPRRPTVQINLIEPDEEIVNENNWIECGKSFERGLLGKQVISSQNRTYKSFQCLSCQTWFPIEVAEVSAVSSSLIHTGFEGCNQIISCGNCKNQMKEYIQTGGNHTCPNCRGTVITLSELKDFKRLKTLQQVKEWMSKITEVKKYRINSEKETIYETRAGEMLRINAGDNFIKAMMHVIDLPETKFYSFNCGDCKRCYPLIDSSNFGISCLKCPSQNKYVIYCIYCKVTKNRKRCLDCNEDLQVFRIKDQNFCKKYQYGIKTLDWAAIIIKCGFKADLNVTETVVNSEL